MVRVKICDFCEMNSALRLKNVRYPSSIGTYTIRSGWAGAEAPYNGIKWKSFSRFLALVR